MIKLYATIVAAAILASVGMGNVFAQTDFDRIDGSEIDSPAAQDMLQKIETARQQFETAKEAMEKRDQHQEFIDKQRNLVQESLNLELQRMEKEHQEFAPRNAFAGYVSGLNSTHHGIFWDQFDYLDAKTKLAKDARDSVLRQGGSYVDAMKQYVKYAHMPKIEMISIVTDLNVKHDFAQDNIQSHFDANGKLPRYEDDPDAPCYGCPDGASDANSQTTPVQPAMPTIDKLQDRLSELQRSFLDSKDVMSQKVMVSEMNKLVQQIQLG